MRAAHSSVRPAVCGVRIARSLPSRRSGLGRRLGDEHVEPAPASDPASRASASAVLVDQAAACGVDDVGAGPHAAPVPPRRSAPHRRSSARAAKRNRRARRPSARSPTGSAPASRMASVGTEGIMGENRHAEGAPPCRPRAGRSGRTRPATGVLRQQFRGRKAVADSPVAARASRDRRPVSAWRGPASAPSCVRPRCGN